MPGPPPKHPSTRARTNRVAGARTLHVAPTGRRRRAPKLPEHREWMPLTRAWWRDVWNSPMAAEFDPSDLHGLLALAVLVDDFWISTDAWQRKAIAGEVRLQSQRFGLSPIDRRRLQWEIDRGDEAERRTRARKAADQPRPVPGPDAPDPRAGLSG